jgi:hypothetical protein
MYETKSIMLEDVERSTLSLFISNCIFAILFASSEYLGECKCKENSVLRVVSQRISCLGRIFRLDVVIERHEGVSDPENEPLIST